MPHEVVPSGAAVPFAYRLNQWIWHSLDWLYPPVCAGCQAPHHRWCPECQSATQTIRKPYCQICGIPVAFHRILICQDCQDSSPTFSAMRSWAIFDGALRQAIHHLKYWQDMALGEVLAYPLEQILVTEHWPIDLVLPVPLSRKRYASRGYNQAALLTKPLAMCFSLPFAPGALKRTKETETQIGLSPEERTKNVADAFHADAVVVEDRTILVVDDVVTTTATMQACAQALIGAGAKQVFALSVARVRHDGLA